MGPGDREGGLIHGGRNLSGTYLTIPKRMFNELVMQINPIITAVAMLLVAVNLAALLVILALSRKGRLLERDLP